MFGSNQFYPVIKLCLAFGFTCLCVSAVFANPVLGNIGAGNVSVQQSSNVTNINQSSQQAILNWQSFNIGQQQATHFYQPAGGVTLNRISATQGASQIYGNLTATGQIILVNPAGIYFGPSSVVNVGGLIATTANITDQNFLNRNYQFENAGPGAITNAGQIIAADHGLVALVGSNVTNNGLIKANLGNVVLASGNAFTVNFGDDLVNFGFTGSSSQNGSVTNNGKLIANGGQILVTAQAAQGVLDNVINMNGIAEAKSIGMQNGDIIISGSANGGVVNISGKLLASGKHNNETGGTVNVTGYDILLNPSSRIDVSGNMGGGNVNIGGDEHGAGPLANANATVMLPGATILANALTSGNGGNVVLWSEAMTKAYGNILANGGSVSGNGGLVETSSHQYLDVNGINVNTLAPQGVSGTWLLDPANLYIVSGASSSNSNVTSSSPFTPINNPVDSFLTDTTINQALLTGNVTIQTSASAAGGGEGDIGISSGTPAVNIIWANTNSLTLSAYDNILFPSSPGSALITNTSGGALNLIANNAGAYQDGAGGGVTIGAGLIDMSGPVTIYYNPTSITTPTNFAGVNSGTGTIIPYLYVHTANDIQAIAGNTTLWTDNFALSANIANVGAFSGIGNSTTAYSGNFNGQGYTISGVTINQPTATDVGFFGNASGTISNLNITGASVTGNLDVGILAGNSTGTVSNSSTSGTVTGGGTNPAALGGLIGNNTGTVTNSESSANISNGGDIGGLIGTSGGTVSDSFSTGNVTGSNDVGGLIGASTAAGLRVSNAYSTGNVTGSNIVGGLVGEDNSNISDTYSTGTVNGGSAGGLVGFLAAAATLSNSFWDTQTSAIAGNGTGSGSGTISNVQAGCFSGSCSGVNLSSSTTYTNAGWDLTNTWGIVSGFSYPYLRVFYPTTPRILSGTITTATAGVAIDEAIAGVVVATTTTAPNGAYYFLAGNNTVTGVNSAIADSTPLLFYIASGGTTGNYVTTAPTGGASLNNLNFTAGGINFVGNSSNSSLATAIGGLSSPFLLYTASGNNLTLNPGVNFSVPSTITYTLNGNISASTNSSSNITFNGPLSLGAAALTLNGGTSGSINILNSLTGNNDALTLDINNPSNSITGNITTLGSLTLTGTGTLSLSGTNTTFNPTLNGTTLVVNNASAFGSGLATVNGNGTLEINGVALNTPNITLNTGSLVGNGTSSYTGAIILASGSTDTLNSLSGVFTVNGNVNGAGTLNIGSGDVVINGSYGNTTPLTAVNSATTTGGFTGSVFTTGNQSYSAPIVLTGATSYNSTNGSILFNNTINGAYALVLNDTNGTTTFNAAVGNTTPLSSLTANSAAVAINGGSVDTSGNQTYNAPVTLGATTTLTANQVALNEGVFGNQNLNLDVINAIMVGPFAINTLTVNGMPANENTISIQNVGNEDYTVTGNNAGTISGITGIGNSVIFTNQPNLVGGTGNTIFTIANGGSLTGSIIGGSGTNTIVDDNANNTWTITGVNSGTLSGVNGTFSNIQNLVSGNGTNNTYTFANGGRITGTINGGSTTGNNIFNFLGLTSSLNVTLNQNIFSGSVFSNNSLLETFSNINSLIANGALHNFITLPLNLSNITVKFTGSLAGLINDPLIFNGFNIIQSPLNVSPIIQQPTTGFNIPEYIENKSVDQNLIDLLIELEGDYDGYLKHIKIDPFCYQNSVS